MDKLKLASISLKPWAALLAGGWPGGFPPQPTEAISDVAAFPFSVVAYGQVLATAEKAGQSGRHNALRRMLTEAGFSSAQTTQVLSKI